MNENIANEVSNNASDVKNVSQVRLSAVERSVEFLLQHHERQHHILSMVSKELIDLKKIVDSNESVSSSKVFVGNLSKETKESDLKLHFGRFGKVVEAFIVRTNPTSQCGFVVFSKKEDAAKVLEMRPHLMGDRRINVQKCRKRYSGKENSSLLGQTPTKSPKPSSSRNTSRFCPY